MSYNQGYGQPQAMMQASQLPYPTYNLVMAPIQVQRGQPHSLPAVQYLPQALQQYFPLIVTDCIDAIQSKAQTNPLRTFLFNQMCQNNFNNLEFTAFVEGVIRLVEMRMAQRAFPDVQQAIFNCAVFYAELNTAANVAKYSELLQGLDRDTVQGVQVVLQNLNQVTQEMQRFFSGMQQNQPQPYGGAPQQQFNPQGYGQPQQQFAPPQQQFYGQPQQQRQPMPSAQWRDQQSNLQAAHMGQPTSSSLFSGTGSGSGYSAMPSDPVAARYETASRARQVEVVEPSLHVQNIQEARRQKEEKIINNVPTMQGVAYAPPTPKPVQVETIVKADDAAVKWKPTEKYPFSTAYNPNVSDLYYQVAPDGSTKPFIKPKEQSDMDMDKHLTVPSYVKTPPLGMKSLDTSVRVFETEKSLTENTEALGHIEPILLNVSYKDDSFQAELSLNEMWFTNEVKLAIMKKSDKKTNLYRSCGAFLKPLVSAKSVKSMVIDVASMTTFEAACNKLQVISNKIDEGTYPHGDAKSLTFINNRLTESLNEFLKHHLAVPNGWVDSFMVDASSVISYIDKKYGTAFASALIDAQSIIISQALLFTDLLFEKRQNTNLFPNEDHEKMMGDVDVTYFYNNYTLTSLDLFSTELKTEIPEGEVSVGIFEKYTPLLRQIADNIMTHQRALGLVFRKHLLKTADDVVFEITQSIIHPDFYLVAVVKD